MSLAAPMPANTGGYLTGWTQLVLEGRKFLIARGRSEIERLPRTGPAGAAAGTEVRVHSEARIFGRRLARHHAVSRLGAGDRLFGWLEWTEGRRLRRAIAGPDGSLRLTRFVPAEGEGDWSPGEKQEVRLWAPDAPRPERPAFDPYGILGRLERLLEAGSGTLDLVTRRGVQTVAFEAEPARRLRMRLRERGESSRSVQLEARRLLLRPAAEGGQTLLQMEGPLELWVEAGSGALLKIRGRQPKIRGDLTLRLSEFSRVTPAPFAVPVEFPDPAPPAAVDAPCAVGSGSVPLPSSAPGPAGGG